MDAAFFNTPKALISGGGRRSVGPPMSKFCNELHIIMSVCCKCMGSIGPTVGSARPSSGQRGPVVHQTCPSPREKIGKTFVQGYP